MIAMEKETLIVKFDGQNHQVDVQTFAYSVLNFASVIKDTNKKLGGDLIQIDIKAPEKGSLLVNLVASVASSTATLLPPVVSTVGFVAGIVTIVGGLYQLHKDVSGKKIQGVKKDNSLIKIQLDDHSEITVAENVYNIYTNTPSIPNSISQNFSALNDDPAVTKFEIIREDKRKIVEVEREDFSRLAIKQQFESENTRAFVESANLHIYKVVFDKTDRKWEFYFKGNRISANITDEDFFKRIDGGESFAKGDQLQVDLKINQVFDESVGAHINQSYQVVKVLEHVKRSEPPELPFNKKV